MSVRGVVLRHAVSFYRQSSAVTRNELSAWLQAESADGTIQEFYVFDLDDCYYWSVSHCG